MSNTLKVELIKNYQTDNDKYFKKEYTCDGSNISPSLKWSNGPKETKSYFVTIYDPDAHPRGWWHWIIFNIPSNITSLQENQIPSESIVGKNSFGITKYGGPCPPLGQDHRYVISVYALNKILKPNEIQLETDIYQILNDSMISKGELTKRYRRSN